MRMKTAILALLMLPATWSHFAHAAELNAGAGKANIQISPDVLPIEGYTGQHDPISARVLLLDDGSQRIGLLIVDIPSIQDSTILHWKEILHNAAGVTPQNALVIASHDTSAPHLFSGEGGMPGRAQASSLETAHAKAYAAVVDAAVLAATKEAAASVQPAKIGFGSGISHINVYRDVLTPKGWTTGYDDSGFTDPSLALVRIDSLSGKTLAWLMNYAVRPAVMEQSTTTQGGKLISGDLVDASERYLEEHADPNAVAMFVMGAAVDQSPYLMSNRFVLDKDGNTSRVDLHEAGFALVDLLGERLGAQAVRVNAGIQTASPVQGLRLERQEVEVDSQPRASAGPNGPVGPRADGALSVPFSILQIGDIAIVGVAPELNANIGVKIKADSPFQKTMVLTMVDGSAKYLPDTVNYDRKTPEAQRSQYARGSAEKVAAQITASLNSLHRASAAN